MAAQIAEPPIPEMEMIVLLSGHHRTRHRETGGMRRRRAICTAIHEWGEAPSANADESPTYMWSTVGLVRNVCCVCQPASDPAVQVPGRSRQVPKERRARVVAWRSQDLASVHRTILSRTFLSLASSSTLSRTCSFHNSHVLTISSWPRRSSSLPPIACDEMEGPRGCQRSVLQRAHRAAGGVEVMGGPTTTLSPGRARSCPAWYRAACWREDPPSTEPGPPRACWPAPLPA